MNQEEPKDFALEGVKVLDITGEVGLYTAKLFIGLGADVIYVEPIDGSPVREMGPFHKDRPDREGGLQFLYYNAGKRAIALDVNRPKGREIFLKLCGWADLLLESFSPGYLDKLDLSHRKLNEVNTKLVHTAITPFGSTGPYRDYPTSDMVSAALGGFLYLGGTGNRKSVRAPDNQSYRMAEAHAAVGSIAALFHAGNTGEGQFVDISIQESVATALENAIQYQDLEGVCRRGHSMEEAGVGFGLVPCKDGYVCVAAVAWGNSHMWDTFVNWMKDIRAEGAELLEGEKWYSPEYRRTDEAFEIYERVVGEYMKKHDMASLYEDGQEHRVAITPVADGKSLWANPHFHERGFWESVYHENLDGDIIFPGAPYRLGECRWQVGEVAPTLGQHTREILENLEYTEDEIETLHKEGVVYVEEFEETI